MEEFYFIAIMAFLSTALFGVMLRFPNLFRHGVVLGMAAFAILMQWHLLHDEPLPGCTLEPRGAGSPLAWWLHMLCLPLVLILLLQILIRPLRRCYSRRVAHLLFASGFSLLTLQQVLWQEGIAPLLIGPSGIAFSLIAVVALILVLLWQLALLALSSMLERCSQRKAQLTRLRAPRSRSRNFLLVGSLFILLTPLLFLLPDKREPQPLPCAEAQRELEELSELMISAQILVSSSSGQDILALLEDFACTGNATLRSEKWGWTMLHLACLHRKPALIHYLIENGADLHAPWGIMEPNRTIAEVLREEDPRLAQWLEAQGISLTKAR